MQAWRPGSYGDAFAEVYDDWYADAGDLEACVGRLAELVREAGTGRLLELGVGTGLVALPLRRTGIAVIGLDASHPMLERLRAKEGGSGVPLVRADMARPPFGSRARFGVAFASHNTLLNLPTTEEQRRAVREAARMLVAGGRLVVETFVPDHLVGGGPSVGVRRAEPDRVVLSTATHDPAEQVLAGQYVDITEAGIRLHPWRIRYASVAELDEMAEGAGLALEDRWAGWHREPFDAASEVAVSIWRRPDTG